MTNLPAGFSDDDEDHEEELVPVTLPSGGVHWVYGRERNHFNDRVSRYLKDNLFTNVADLQELDRIVTMELFCWRWGVWLSQQVDYWNDPVDEKDLNGYIKNTSAELRALKSSLGIDKVTRDKVKGEDSVSKYIENLKVRAKEFGVMREEQLAVSIEIMNDLMGRVTLYDNCSEDERRELHCDIDDLLTWLRDDAFPRFSEVDAHFRENTQRFWIRDQ